jgi:hypothetical protein
MGFHLYRIVRVRGDDQPAVAVVDHGDCIVKVTVHCSSRERDAALFKAGYETAVRRFDHGLTGGSSFPDP